MFNTCTESDGKLGGTWEQGYRSNACNGQVMIMPSVVVYIWYMVAASLASFQTRPGMTLTYFSVAVRVDFEHYSIACFDCITACSAKHC